MEKSQSASAAEANIVDKNNKIMSLEEYKKQYGVPAVIYTPEETFYRGQMILELCAARDNREKGHPEFDNMPYSVWYDFNRQADLSYITPRKNRTEISITSGITHKKDNTLVASMLGYNFQQNTIAFNEDNMIIAELGEQIEDINKKSEQDEDWEIKRQTIYREFFSQGDVFVEMSWLEDYRPAKSEVTWKPGDPVDEAYKNDGIQKLIDDRTTLYAARCESRLIHGKKVYLGNIREENYKKQQLIYTYEIITRDEAKSIYGSWDRWENVPFYVDRAEPYATPDSSVLAVYPTYNWNLTTIDNRNQVGLLKAYWPFKNETMIMLNGVMVLPIKFPLTKISPTGECPLVHSGYQRIPNFSYSKSEPSVLRLDQEAYDESIKLMFEIFRQRAKPAFGNRTKRVFSYDVLTSGRITTDVKPDQLFPLINQTGLTNADFSFHQMLKQDADAKSINPQFSGESPAGDPTATEINTVQQQQLLDLGLAFDGIINLEREIGWARTFINLEHMCDPVGKELDSVRKTLKDIYKNITVPTERKGQKGHKIIRFQTDNIPTEMEQFKEQQKLSKKHGTNVWVVYLNPLILKQMKKMFYMMIVPSARTNDRAAQMLFVSNLQQALELFGQQALNMDYLAQRYATKIGENYHKMFKGQSIMDALASAQNNGMVGNSNGGGGQGGAPSPTPYPTKSKSKPMPTGMPVGGGGPGPR